MPEYLDTYADAGGQDVRAVIARLRTLLELADELRQADGFAERADEVTRLESRMREYVSPAVWDSQSGTFTCRTTPAAMVLLPENWHEGVEPERSLCYELAETLTHTSLALHRMRQTETGTSSDPLDDIHLFTDYEQSLLLAPRLGEPRLDWSIGVGADGNEIRYGWDEDEPHLLIAGASGSGKTDLLNSLLLQLLHNNDPDDVDVWLMTPKHDLLQWRGAEGVKVFIDAHQFQSGTILQAAAKTFQSAEEEMNRRHTLMKEHERMPRDITECRSRAARNPERDGDLNFPFLFLVVDECASFFIKPMMKDESDDFIQLRKSVDEIARNGRSAGVYLIFATQYPVKNSVPTAVKRHCRRIGFFTLDNVGSVVAIDQPGLELIRTPGRGKALSNGEYVDFRSYLMEVATDRRNPYKYDALTQRIRQLRQDSTPLKLPPSLMPNAVAEAA